MDGGNESFIELELVGVWTHAAQENQEKQLSVGKNNAFGCRFIS
jgi:hypothetical protein